MYIFILNKSNQIKNTILYIYATVISLYGSGKQSNMTSIILTNEMYLLIRGLMIILPSPSFC